MILKALSQENMFKYELNMIGYDIMAEKYENIEKPPKTHFEAGVSPVEI